MTDDQKLLLVRLVHTIIYFAMAASVFTLLYAGITGARGTWLVVALVLVCIEAIVFAGNRFRCPLTSLAQKYGAEKGYAMDTLLPEWLAVRTFQLFGTLAAIGLLLLVARSCWPR